MTNEEILTYTNGQILKLTDALIMARELLSIFDNKIDGLSKRMDALEKKEIK